MMEIKKLPQTDARVIAVRKAEEKLAELHHERHMLSDEIEKRCEQLRQKAVASETQDKIEAEAEAMIRGALFETESAKEIQELRHKLDVLDRACQMQASVLDVARGQLSVALAKINRDNYVEVQKRISRAVDELARANEAEVNFFRGLEDAGCSSNPYRPMRLTYVGTISDRQSVAAFHKKEVETYCPEALQ